MNKPTLVIMAAGLGSRFGGNKQITPIDDAGQLIIDYSVYDALRAGFGKAVFVIKPEMEAEFRAAIGERIAGHMEVAYAYQTLNRLPQGVDVPQGRIKPWGTGHAVLCAADEVQGPFAAINADDFYGAGAFAAAAAFLRAEHAATEHALVAYNIENTLSESGSVSRGVCSVRDGVLTGIMERTCVVPRPGGAAYIENGAETFLPAGTPVSMNLWAFNASMMREMKKRFALWLRDVMPQNPQKAEFYLPLVPNALIGEGTGCIHVLRTGERWFGVTYHEDLAGVMESVRQMKADGLYPPKLWE